MSRDQMFWRLEAAWDQWLRTIVDIENAKIVIPRKRLLAALAKRRDVFRGAVEYWSEQITRTNQGHVV